MFRCSTPTPPQDHLAFFQRAPQSNLIDEPTDAAAYQKTWQPKKNKKGKATILQATKARRIQFIHGYFYKRMREIINICRVYCLTVVSWYTACIPKSKKYTIVINSINVQTIEEIHSTKVEENWDWCVYIGGNRY
jgi:hypothetical protein